MGWQVFILEILKTTDLMTIISLSIIGFVIGFMFYDRATRSFNERIDKSESNLRELVNKSESNLRELVNKSESNLRELVNKSESNLREYIDATIKPIGEQVYNHIPTQIKAMEEKFDRKFDELYGLLINKGKDVKKEHAKDKEKPT